MAAMSKGPRILVIDGNVARVRARLTELLGYDSGTGYARVLKDIEPSLEIEILAAADGDSLPPGVGLEQFHGVTMTGSALNIYDVNPAVTRQVELARAVFEAGVPFFGSCWGLQVAVTAAGGEVRANPKGREFGFGRRIQLTEAGRLHRLFTGKPAVFEAPTIHKDSVVSLPADALTLAHNDYGIQAASFSCGRGQFWGVQYHPEYDYRDLAAIAERYGQTLVDEGMFADLASLRAFAADLNHLQAHPQDGPLAWKHGLGEVQRSPALRRLEIRNWLDTHVLKRAR